MILLHIICNKMIIYADVCDEYSEAPLTHASLAQVDDSTYRQVFN